MECQPELKPFVTITSKRDLSEALWCAQTALINPGTNPADFRPGGPKSSRVGKPQVQFSPNVVVMDISGPGLPNLSFFDLPGVISQHSEDFHVQMIENLVLGYINEENCLIIQTLTMDHDAANSAAAGLIKRAKATERTIGVLTKPDRLNNESIDQYASILRNERFPLGKGYYVVLNNTRDEDPARARQREEDFFKATQYFSHDLAAYRDRFGTLKLQQEASRILFQNSVNCLPSLHGMIDGKLGEIKQAHDDLPKPPEGNLSFDVVDKISTLTSRVKLQVEGGPNGGTFFSQWHEKAQVFRNMIVFSYPRVNLPKPPPRPAPTDTKTARDGNSPVSSAQNTVETIDLIDDAPAYSSGLMARGRGAIGRPVKRKRRLEGNPEMTAAKGKLRSSLEATKAHLVIELAKTFNFNDLTKIIQRMNQGVPVKEDIGVISFIHKASSEHWVGLLNDYLSETEKLCEALITAELKIVLQQWQRTLLFQNTKAAVERFLRRVFKENREFVSKLRELESRKLITVNSDAKQEAERLARDELDERRVINRMRWLESGIPQGRPIDAKKLDEEVRTTLDPFDNELAALAVSEPLSRKTDC